MVWVFKAEMSKVGGCTLLAALFLSGKSFSMYMVVHVVRLVYFSERNQCHKSLIFPFEHAQEHNQVIVEIMTWISPDTRPGLPALFALGEEIRKLSSPLKTEY